MRTVLYVPRQKRTDLHGRCFPSFFLNGPVTGRILVWRKI
jgi:hypothetical protein